MRSTPALLPGAAFVAGAAVGRNLASPSLLALGLAAALAFAVRRRGATVLGFALLGVIVVAAQGNPDLETRLDLGRPVEAEVRIVAPWQPGRDGWLGSAEIVRLRQGISVVVGGGGLGLTFPTGERPPGQGAIMRVRGQLSRASELANYVTSPAARLRLRVKSRQLMSVERGAGPAGRIAEAVRRPLNASREERTGQFGPGEALARALVLGETAEVPGTWKRGLRRTGLYHLLSVSGVHVGLVAMLALLPGTLLPGRWRLLPAALAIVAYLVIVGPAPALLRAAVMGLIGVAAVVLGRAAPPANALAVAAAGMIAWNPRVVGELSFQLSCSATAGLVLLAPLLERRLTRLPRMLRRALAATIGAQLASLPLALPTFHSLSLLSPLFNLLAIPLTGAMLALAFLWLAAMHLAPAGGVALLGLLELVARPFAWPALVPTTRLVVWPLDLDFGAAVLVAGAITLLLLLPGGRSRRLLLAGLVLAASGDRDRAPASFQLAMIDVGQGDAVLLRAGENAVLIDGGGGDGRETATAALVPTFARLGVTRLDAMVLSHPDLDHCGGLLELAAYVPVEQVWTADLEASQCASELFAAVRTVQRLRAGSERSAGPWRFAVLAPRQDDGKSDNDRSLVLLASGGGRRVLLPGDIEAQSERELLFHSREELRADVLKVAHHGSRSSSLPTFLDAVGARRALISVGRENRFGHPAATTLERLAARRALTLRTDLDGLVLLSWEEGTPLRVELPAERFRLGRATPGFSPP